MTTIRPRRVEFDLSSTPRWYVPGDPQTTHTANALSLLLPAGERWFVRVFREALAHVDDTEIEKAIVGFMGQEGNHARVHDVQLEFLTKHEIDVEPFTRGIDWLFERLLAPNPLGKELPEGWRRGWLLHRVALIAAIEHFTTFLGDWVLAAHALDQAGADPVALGLLRWHGAEEVEHRAVAFDTANHLGATWVTRAIGMAEAAPVFLALWARGAGYLMRADSEAPKASWRSFHRAGQRGVLPTAKALLLEIPRYLRPGFHPSQSGSIERAIAYLAHSPTNGVAFAGAAA